MATQGPMTFFDWALSKTWDGTFHMVSDAWKAVLCTSAQSISRSFVGTSGDARYADLTAELPTANGYTVGGVLLSSVAVARVVSNKIRWTSSPPGWTIATGPITFKYMIIYNNTDVNKSLLGFCDMDTGGGSVSAGIGPMTVSPDAANGFFYGQQP